MKPQEYTILKLLKENPMLMTELQKRLGFTTNGIVGVMAFLEKYKLVETMESDKHELMAKITPRGLQLLNLPDLPEEETTGEEITELMEQRVTDKTIDLYTLNQHNETVNGVSKMVRTLTPEQEAMLIEKLAELEHEQWMNWSKVLTKEIAEHLNWLPEDMRIELSARLARWNSMWVPYDVLTEKAKEQDRVWARKVRGLLGEFNIPTFIAEQETMEISEEEASTILSSLGNEDGEITEKELTLEKRIRQEFPVIDEEVKKSEHRDHLWEYEVEDDKRVREAREKLEKHFSDAILKEFMNLKREVLHELLEKEAAK